MRRVEDHIGLAYRAARKFTPRGHCVEDSEYYAEALIALMMAARGHKTEFGKFSTFASRCIRNRIYNLYKANRNNIEASSLENDVEDKEAIAFDIKALMSATAKKDIVDNSKSWRDIILKAKVTSLLLTKWASRE